MKTSDALVTIGVASYNNEKYVIKTLESIRKQTYSNIELIIVDDGSTDNSVHLIEQWLSDYKTPNTRFICHSVNRGLCAVCNTIVTQATGHYMSIVGSDDIFMPEKTSCQVGALQEAGDDFAVVYSDMYIIDENGTRATQTQIHSREPGFIPDEGDIYLAEIVRNCINTPSAMTLVKAVREVGGYDESLSFEDWDMWLRLSRIYKVKYSDYISVEYRVLATSLWNKRGKSFFESNIKILVKQLGYNSQVDYLALIGIADYAQLIYKLYGRDATPWLQFVCKRKPTLKLRVLSVLAALGIPYSLYDKAARLVSK